jgi:putative inorganic carbon (HCO3(-)) transporter
VSIHFGLEGLLVPALYVGGMLVFLISVFVRPAAGVYLLAFTLPLQTGRYRLHQYPLGAQFVDITLLGVILGMTLRREELRLRTPVTAPLLFLAIYYYAWLVRGSLYLNAPLPFSIDDPRFSNWKNYVELFAFALVVPNVIRKKAQVRTLILVMCASFLVVNRSFYHTISSRDLSHFSYEERDAGPLGYAGENGFAAFETMFCAFLLGLHSFARRQAVKLALLGLIATGCYCILYSFSRGAYLASLGVLIVLGVLRQRKLILVFVLLLVIWQAVLPEAVQERILMTKRDETTGQFESSAQERLDLWEDAKGLFLSSPIAGIGFDTYEFLGRVGPFRDTHNYYIKVAVETGIVGLVAFLWLLLKMCRLGYQLFRSSDDPFWASVGLGFVGLMSAAVLLNFFGDRWTYQQVNGFMWMLFGCVLRGLRIAASEASEAATSYAPVVATAPHPGLSI